MVAVLFRLFGWLMRFLFRVVTVICASSIAIAIITYASFDGDAYVAGLARSIASAAGQNVSISGKAELYPTLPPRIVLHNLQIKNVRWGKRQDMLRARQVEITINPLAAISGGDSVTQVRLDGADVLYETKPSGETNWSALVAGGVTGSVVPALSAIGLLAPIFSFRATPSPPPIVFSNTKLTTIDGGSGATVVVPIGDGFPIEIVSGGSLAGPPGPPGSVVISCP